MRCTDQEESCTVCSWLDDASRRPSCEQEHASTRAERRARRASQPACHHDRGCAALPWALGRRAQARAQGLTHLAEQQLRDGVAAHVDRLQAAARSQRQQPQRRQLLECHVRQRRAVVKVRLLQGPA